MILDLKGSRLIHVPDPFAAVQPGYAPYGLDDVVYTKGYDSQPAGAAKHRAHDDAEGDAGDPHEEDVRLEEELGVSAAAKDAFGHDALDVSKNGYEAISCHHLLCYDHRISLQVVESEGEGAYKEYQGSVYETEDDTEQIEGLALLHGLLLASCTYGIA